MNLFNYPVDHDRAAYDSAIDRMLKRLSSFTSVVAVYKVGSVSCPGISDIDLVVVFDDTAKCDFLPLDGMSSADRYLFTHSLFGVRQRTLSEIAPYNLFHNFKVIQGQDVLVRATPSEQVKRQIAMEYLVRMLINITVAGHQKHLDVRSTLLQAHAIRYDLEFLGIEDGALFDDVSQVIQWRNNWFVNPPSDAEFSFWYQRFDTSLCQFIQHHAVATPLYLPDRPEFKIGRNIRLRRAECFATSVNGFPLPTMLTRRHPLAKKISTRLSRFRIDLPWNSSDIPNEIREMFRCNEAVRDEVATNFPNFYSLTSSLHLN